MAQGTLSSAGSPARVPANAGGAACAGQNGLARCVLRPAGLVIVLALSGCAAPTGPEVLSLPPARYEEAFDAAVAALRDVGMTTDLRDRAAGVIEATPRRAGTVIEPWRTDNSGLGQAFANTVSLQRRRARFEFTLAGFEPQPIDPDAPLPGPDLLGPEMPGDPHMRADDIAAASLRSGTPIEMRVWVYLEQAHTPGLRRYAWTRLLTTRTIDPQDPIDPAEGVLATSIWTPIARDEPYERRLMGDVARRLAFTWPTGDRSSDTEHPPPG